jgi:hypothetical protein
MPSQVMIKGDTKIFHILGTLPDEIDKRMSVSNITFLRAVKKSARLRIARHKMSGELSESMRILPTKRKGKTKQTKLVVLSPYGIYQEEGYKGHFVHAGTPTKNKLGTIGDVYNIAGFMWIKRFSGLHFMRDAVEKQLSTFSQKIDKSVKGVIKK